jgi:hypothetical protein
MTGVNSSQVLGSEGAKESDDEVAPESDMFSEADETDKSFGTSDGGQDKREKNSVDVDVIR